VLYFIFGRRIFGNWLLKTRKNLLLEDLILKTMLERDFFIKKFP
jgi:hypothetical protein